MSTVRIKLPPDFKERCEEYILTKTEFGKKEMDKFDKLLKKVDEMQKWTPEQRRKHQEQRKKALDRIYTEIDYTDTNERKAWERKWDVLQTIWQYFISNNRPQRVLIPIQAFAIKGRTVSEIDGILDGLEKREGSIFSWHRGTDNYEVIFILSTNVDRFTESYKRTKQVYKKFASIFEQSKRAEKSSSTSSRLKIPNQEQKLEVVRNLIKIANFYSTHSSSDNQVRIYKSAEEFLSETRLDEFENPQEVFEGIIEESENAIVADKMENGINLQRLQPGQHNLGGYEHIYLTIDLKKLKNYRDSVNLKIASGGQQKNNRNLLTLKVKSGSLNLNTNTGDAKLNNVSTNFNPKSQEFQVLLRLMSSIDYQATYKDLLGESDNKNNRRNLAFVVRNIKEQLGILPLKTSQNKNCIKNIKGHGYRLMT